MRSGTWSFFGRSPSNCTDIPDSKGDLTLIIELSIYALLILGIACCVKFCCRNLSCPAPMNETELRRLQMARLRDRILNNEWSDSSEDEEEEQKLSETKIPDTKQVNPPALIDESQGLNPEDLRYQLMEEGAATAHSSSSLEMSYKR